MNELDDFRLIHSPGDYELWKLCKLLVEAAEWRRRVDARCGRTCRLP